MRDGEDLPEAFLAGVRVLEVGDELGEYAGKILAGVGAEVIKIEPPQGEATRTFGPFYADEPSPDRSLYFWHYNFGKLSVTLDLDNIADQRRFKCLLESTDVLLQARPKGYFEARGLGYAALKSINPKLIVARISPFGEDGPWADYLGSDLIHLALGGVMMDCGYDPDPSGFYETPPIAPQMWQAYHIAGEMTAMAILGALTYAENTGKGQFLSTAVHEAVAKATEQDLPNWIYSRLPHFRKTCRHSMPDLDPSVSISMTKDGRWLFPYRTYVQSDDPKHRGRKGDFGLTVTVLDKLGLAEDLTDAKYDDPAMRSDPVVMQHYGEVLDRAIRRFLFARDLWRDFQEAGLTWAPERRPEENIADEHWKSRETFFDVAHPEVGRTLTEIGAKWFCPEVPWRKGPRAPSLGEHNEAIVGAESRPAAKAGPSEPARPTTRNAGEPINSCRGKPFALSGVRYIDLGWIVASPGAGRFLAGLGAEVIKVEHKSRIDRLRYMGGGRVPPGGRLERDRATSPLTASEGLNRSGMYMDINAGKRAISLNLKHPSGRELLAELVKKSHLIGEGYSPGTMDRLGMGYEQIKAINPAIVYVQQSGMGQLGTYGRFRSYGPVAAGFAGTSEMSGLSEPFPPAGIGYSYLDLFGAYNMAIALLAGLYRQKVTGKGCWIDSSQVESGIYLNGSAILDFSANGRRWYRYGNRSPYKRAAPHGAYRTNGEDRWIAIACFDDVQWEATMAVLGGPGFARDSRFATLAGRLVSQDDLDEAMSTVTIAHEGYALMDALQKAGVPAGVCQTAEDRLQRDPQLACLDWLVELTQSEIGMWPVLESPVKFSETPPFQGGIVNRHGPSYAEDNAFVFGEILGLSEREIRKLEAEEVL